jgi:cell division initiation protein
MTRKKTLSPIDIQSHNFRTKLKGYDKDDVKLFLNAIAESYQELALEHAKLSKEVERLDSSLEEFRSRENLLKDALYSAQKSADDTKAQAGREAQSILKEAELKGEQSVREAMVRAHLVERQIMDLKIERETLISSLKDLINRLTHLVAAIEENKGKENIQSFAKESL